jgi:hypothetical protein
MTHLQVILRKKQRSKIIARNRMIRASGFAWVAREPQLMYGAKGARILTEINRLPHSFPVSNRPTGKGTSTFTGSLSAGPEPALAIPP